MENQQIKTKLSLIQVDVEERLNAFHKQMGETLNSRSILNEFIIRMNLEFETLIKDLQEE